MTDSKFVRLHFHMTRKGHRRILREGPRPERPTPRGRIPRIARLVALAHKFEGLLRDGKLESMADIARVGHVTRARVTQIMDLLLLAPDIQEELLHLPATTRGYDAITLRELRYVMQTPVWAEQRSRLARTDGSRAVTPTPPRGYWLLVASSGYKSEVPQNGSSERASLFSCRATTFEGEG